MVFFIKAVGKSNQDPDEKGTNDEQDHYCNGRSFEFAVLDPVIQCDGGMYFIHI